VRWIGADVAEDVWLSEHQQVHSQWHGVTSQKTCIFSIITAAASEFAKGTTVYDGRDKQKSDVWLTVHRNSVWIRNHLDVTFVLSFISLLQIAQHVSGNHVPIFRSWRLHCFIAMCWYCAVKMSGVIQICLSVSVLCVVMWGVMGGGIIVVCRCGLVCS
jgi:hypothetical protein